MSRSHVRGAARTVSPLVRPAERFHRATLANLPTLIAGHVTLRPLRKSDGRAVVLLCSTPPVAEFLSMPIVSSALFERYLGWLRRQRRQATGASFAVEAGGRMVGLMQVRVTHPGVGELGWVLHPAVWGSHVFRTAAALLLDFASATMRLARLEARVAVGNLRARRAIAKMGATREGTLCGSLRLHERYFDEELWAISTTPAREPRMERTPPARRSRTQHPQARRSSVAAGHYRAYQLRAA